MDAPDLAFMEIGRRGALTFSDVAKAVDAWKGFRRQWGSQFQTRICIGGYDDDPREIWEIPEAARAVRLFASLIGAVNLDTTIRLKVHVDTIKLFTACQTFGPCNVVKGGVPS